MATRKRINTGGGAVISGKVKAGRDVVGRDLIQKQIIIRGTDPASRALKTYLGELRAECTVLPIAAMGGDEEARGDVTLDQVYIELNTTTTAQKRKRKQDDAQEATAFLERVERRLSVLDAVLANEQVVLLGGPGSGKSSFVNQLMAEVAAARLKKDPRLKKAPAELLSRVPLKVVLRELAERLAEAKLDEASDARLLLARVQEHWSAELKRLGGAKAETAVRALLQEGRGLLIFDGLDEVSLEYRLVIRKAVKAVLDQYAGSRVIVTCRSRSYPDSRFEGFAEFTLDRLNEGQIKAFIAAWYAAHVALKRLPRKEADERAQDLTHAALSDYRALASESPLLLTVMAIVHRKGVTLPRQEVVLYDEAVKVLLSRWQQEKRLKLHPDVQKLLADPARLDAVVQSIAYAQHALQGRDNDPQALMPRRDVIELLEGPDLLGTDFNIHAFLNFVDQVSGLLIGHGGNPDGRDKRPLAYGFPHRTFQEYLAGRRMMWNNTRARRRMLLQHAEDGDYWSVAARYGWESLLYLGNTRNTDLLDLAQELCSNDPPDTPARWRANLWAGRMAALAGREAIVRFVEEEEDSGLIDERLIPRLLDIMTKGRLPAVERAQAGRALAALGDPRFDPQQWHLPNESLLGFIPVPAGSVFMGTRPADFDRVMQVIGAAGEEAKDYRERIASSEINPGESPTPVPAFFIACFPTTVAQFRSFAQATGREADYQRVLRDPDNQPAVNISWHDALAYCNWLGEQLMNDDRAPAPLRDALRSGTHRVTLPSEAEWEYAARGPAEGNENPHRIFTWPQDQFDSEWANTAATRIGRPSAVGCFPDGISPLGCEDMLGNVWEWTRSLWGKDFEKPDYGYPYSQNLIARENLSAEDRVKRVLRGGAFSDIERLARCAYRLRFSPVDWNGLFGFRIVVSPISL